MISLHGGLKRTLLKPPKQVAKVLYTQCSKKDFYIPEFRIEEAKELLSEIEYVLWHVFLLITTYFYNHTITIL